MRLPPGEASPSRPIFTHGAFGSWAPLALSALAACSTSHAQHSPSQRTDEVGAAAHVQILALNDFHGQLSTDRSRDGHPVGGAAVLASFLRRAERGREAETLFVHAGDLVGASPAASALLRDEPTLLFMNLFANAHCRGVTPRMDGATRCNVVGTLGNHEFDHGTEALLRLLQGEPRDGGTAAAASPFDSPYPGARFPYVCANVTWKRDGRPLLPPYVIVESGGERIAFIGALLAGAPSIIARGRVEGLAFEDEATAINRYLPQIQRAGVHAIVVLLHQGGHQAHYDGATQEASPPVRGDVAQVVARLDRDVDVVISGHTHTFTNALLPNAAGAPVLVTQAYAQGTAYARIELTLDRATHDVSAKSARIESTWADRGPGLTPDPTAAALVHRAERAVAALTERKIATAATAIGLRRSATGESPLGDLVADAQRTATGADIAFMNPGGLRASLPAGSITWGALFAVQPFQNALIRMHLTGREVLELLESQWDRPAPKVLQVSGIHYTYSPSGPAGHKVLDAQVGAPGALRPLEPEASYTVVANEFLAAGGDGFTLLAHGRDRVTGPSDLDALVDYLRRLPQPFGAPEGQRMESTVTP